MPPGERVGPTVEAAAPLSRTRSRSRSMDVFSSCHRRVYWTMPACGRRMTPHVPGGMRAMDVAADTTSPRLLDYASVWALDVAPRPGRDARDGCRCGHAIARVYWTAPACGRWMTPHVPGGMRATDVAADMPSPVCA